jgi:hypothetical protein
MRVLSEGLKTSTAGQGIGAALIVCVVATLAGCVLPGSTALRTPSVTGVVEEVGQLPDGGKSYRLVGGSSVDVASQAQVLLGGEPVVGELLLAGADPDGRQWVAGVGLSPIASDSGCFWFTSNGRDADSGWVETGGFRLRKGAQFDPAYVRDGNYQSPRGYFCLNESGEVTSYVPA